MTGTPSAYPLAWPPGWPRTPLRQAGPYRTQLSAALKNLAKEVKLLAGQTAANGLILSSNVTLGREEPKDPGVVAFFTYDKLEVAIPCDRWATVAANVQAIALTIEAMRAMERHGAKHMIRAMFQGFVALPAPGQDWREVLGNPRTRAEADATYRERARRSHPDAGGSADAMAALNAARDQARRELPDA